MIYVSTACLSGKKISDIVQRLAENGFKNIELSGGTLYYENIENDLIDLQKEYNLNYACHAYFPPPKNDFVVNLSSCNDEIYHKSIEHYNNCVAFLEKIHCNVLSIHAGFMVEINKDQIGKKLHADIIYDENEAYNRFCSAYKNLRSLCNNKGIELFLENNVLSRENYEQFSENNYLMMTDYSSIMKMKKMLDFELLLDLGHLHVSDKTLQFDYGLECNNLNKYVKWFHISENNGIVDQHKPLQENSDILRQYIEMKQYSKNITLETVGSEEEILNSYKLLERVLGNL